MSDAWPEGVARHVLARTDSTNAEALKLAPGLSGSAWVLAREQFAGRGRRGREWVMPAGNFAGTLVLRPQGGALAAAQLSFVAALALYDALGLACGPAARLAIKWPNDVLLNGGKVAGILLESSGSGPGVQAVAVGIGVNLAAAPDAGAVEPGATPPVSVQGETGHAVDPEEFLDLLAPAFARWQAQLDTYGFAPIRNAWLARAARLGEPIIARTGTAESHGIFEGIDDSGALILRGPAGRQVIPAAEVFFGG
ncbi:biotin--[acetyl-CoA-carboxylase] ligase [Paracoccus denitrificans]|uniref:biotin--[biotin carboxyl-carrier protein] ligase n=1 Tax=Paracoccus denitrificans (strain Pd 1222) TaxID=318586 RepID=A1B478_PARDP|nr:biotin--[acetyl-CoA-carboxylase] ligase [Paracoccus denitrificans]ABL70322.1 biotin--acetyl-CoA-carboxylase ligase [Paracoccus denitrificans PD1222]MBB4627231.1 BirA family biotin operon repressor/biotin-[acetyl-CoA-carboxylase] ligase [Paracoccus denitrificans]MCU7427996.1 biotin--[acetyl-CoA-carboxylase] ligase [Paracoccus denitrificans]QAR25672.1 biotin--[acetyl-CoA-carboxylase] ligase [Paracoccus denitrificans]UPV94570.1 biotin--[acetyl-CoA-carboxylase] ligase [Paracoccus denitrificans]